MGVREDYELRDGASPSVLERCAISAVMDVGGCSVEQRVAFQIGLFCSPVAGCSGGKAPRAAAIGVWWPVARGTQQPVMHQHLVAGHLGCHRDSL